MRPAICAVALLAALGAGTAVRAAELPVRFSLTIEIPTLPAVGPYRPGVALEVNGGLPGLHLQSLTIPAGFVRSTTQISVTASSAAPIGGVQITAANGLGAFAESALGRMGGAMPLLGFAKACLFGTCDSALANVTLPLDVIGVGGATAAEGPVNVTVQGAPWTTGPLPTPSTGGVRGTRRGPLGARSTTAQIGGQLNLVTPIMISTNLAPLARIDAVGRVTLAFGSPADCDVEVDRERYVDGDTVRITRLRFANPQIFDSDFRVRVGFVVPIDGGREVMALDRTFRGPQLFDADLAPIDAVPVGPEQPRGDYQLFCSISDVRSGESRLDRAAFRIE